MDDYVFSLTVFLNGKYNDSVPYHLGYYTYSQLILKLSQLEYSGLDLGSFLIKRFEVDGILSIYDFKKEYLMGDKK